MSHSSLRILVVDDEINILKSMKRLFKQAGYEVFIASSGAEGLALLEKQHINVILSDFRMPQMDGGQFLSKVKALYPHIVSLILSGYADFDSVLVVMNSGNAYKFLTKPWENAALLEEVEEAFRHYQAHTQLALSLEQSKFYENTIQLNETVKQLFSAGTPFTLGYFELSNASDLKRQQIDIGSLTQLLHDYIREQWKKNCSLHVVNENSLVLLTLECDEFSHFSKLVTNLEQYLWHTLHDHKVDVGVSFIASTNLDTTTDYILETLKEATVRIHSSSQITPIDHQYLLSKQRQLTIKSDVGRALRMNHLSLVYQPKIALGSGVIESAEVLLRWYHKSLGWISPEEFIDVLEADGQINSITDWVIDNGLKELSRLLKISNEIQSFSINVSASQLINLNIVKTIKAGLHKYQIDPSKLEIEVTETSLIENLTTTSRTLDALKDLGVTIAIDDFGVGYSSFAYLTKLPIDVLKLDRALLEDIEFNHDTLVLVENLVKTCHNLNIKVVAEGIETQAALEKVNLTNCDYVQGFYYSAPVSCAEIEQLFVEQPFLINVS